MNRHTNKFHTKIRDKKDKPMHIMADIDMNRLIEEIEEDVIDIAALATDAEITRQFETIQKELEGILKSYIKDVLEGKL